MSGLNKEITKCPIKKGFYKVSDAVTKTINDPIFLPLFIQPGQSVEVQMIITALVNKTIQECAIVVVNYIVCWHLKKCLMNLWWKIKNLF